MKKNCIIWEVNALDGIRVVDFLKLICIYLDQSSSFDRIEHNYFIQGTGELTE
jgi:hypothetical protein